MAIRDYLLHPEMLFGISRVDVPYAEQVPLSTSYDSQGNAVDVPGERPGIFSEVGSSVSNLTSSVTESAGSLVGNTLASTIKPLFPFLLIVIVVYVGATVLSKKIVGA